jgi:hypothetical protein
MSLLMHPHDIIWRLAIAHEDGGLAWNRTYYLVLTDTGTFAIRAIQSYEQPYKTPDVAEIEPAAFGSTKINGVALREILIENLRKLPGSS